MHSLDFAWSVPWCDLLADVETMVSVQTGKLLQLHMFTIVRTTVLPAVNRQHQKATHMYMLLSCQHCGAAPTCKKTSSYACLLTGGRCTTVCMVFVL